MKLTSTGLLLLYHRHVDNRYKLCLLTTMLDRAYRLSSSWAYFSEECERFKSLFSRLKYPQHLINSTINTFVNSWVTGQHPSQASVERVGNDVTRVVIPFKDGAYYCYCAYALRISRYSDSLINTGIFLRGSKLWGKAELSKCSWYPQRKLGVTRHFSEIIKLQFGKECHTLLCILKLFTNIVY